MCQQEENFRAHRPPYPGLQNAWCAETKAGVDCYADPAGFKPTNLNFHTSFLPGMRANLKYLVKQVMCCKKLSLSLRSVVFSALLGRFVLTEPVSSQFHHQAANYCDRDNLSRDPMFGP